MSTEQIVALLIAERDRLNRAIEALQGPVKRRGRPPKNPLDAVAPAPIAKNTTRAGRTFTPEQKQAQAERMKAMWAKKKKKAAKKG